MVIFVFEGPADLRLDRSEEAPRVTSGPQRTKKSTCGLLHMLREGADPVEAYQLRLYQTSVRVPWMVAVFM